MLSRTYWYEEAHILELMYNFLNLKKSTNVKYIEIY